MDSGYNWCLSYHSECQTSLLAIGSHKLWLLVCENASNVGFFFPTAGSIVMFVSLFSSLHSTPAVMVKNYKKKFSVVKLDHIHLTKLKLEKLDHISDPSGTNGET